MAGSIRTVRLDEFPEFMRFLERCYGHSRGFFERHYPHHYRADAEACNCFHVVEADGRIVSHVGLYPLEFVVAGVRLQVAGIGGVATLPEWRGKGCMTRLLEHAIGVMRESGAVVSCLGGDRQRYGEFGWELAGTVYQLHFSRRSLARSGVAVVPVEEQAPVDAVAHLSRLQTQQPCHAVRPHFDLQLARPGLRVWVTADGYAIGCGENTGSIRIEELVSVSGQEPAMLRAILEATCNHAVSWSVSAWDTRIDRLMPCLSSWASEPEAMCRIIDLNGFLRACQPFLAQKTSGMGDFKASLGVREKDRVRGCSVRLQNGGLAFSGDEEDDRVGLDAVDAARLFLGGLPSPTVRLPESLQALLPLPFHIPALDHV